MKSVLNPMKGDADEFKYGWARISNFRDMCTNRFCGVANRQRIFSVGFACITNRLERINYAVRSVL